jgi:acyl-coenzyme A thioesterase PaaI-like protein
MPRSSSPRVDQTDHRTAARFDTALAVDVAGLKGEARNISATGVYFETDVDMPLGSVVNLNVQFTHGGRKHWLACEGRVVRVTQAGGHHGIGAELVTPFFTPEQETIVARPARR